MGEGKAVVGSVLLPLALPGMGTMTSESTHIILVPDYADKDPESRREIVDQLVSRIPGDAFADSFQTTTAKISIECIQEDARALLVQTRPVTPFYAPAPRVILFGYGYGGLVCEQAVLLLQQRLLGKPYLRHRATGLVLLDTPHFHAALAQWLRWRLTPTPDDAIAAIASMQASFRDQLGPHLPVACCFTAPANREKPYLRPEWAILPRVRVVRFGAKPADPPKPTPSRWAILSQAILSRARVVAIEARPADPPKPASSRDTTGVETLSKWLTQVLDISRGSAPPRPLAALATLVRLDQETSSFNGEYYVPRGALDKLITRNRVLMELKHAGMACDDSTVDFVLDKAKKVFAILTMADLLPAVKDSKDSGFTDEYLPVGQKGGQIVSLEPRSCQLGTDALEWFETGNMSKKRTRFIRHQWSFLAPVFELTGVAQRHEDTVLPFKEYESTDIYKYLGLFPAGGGSEQLPGCTLPANSTGFHKAVLHPAHDGGATIQGNPGRVFAVCEVTADAWPRSHKLASAFTHKHLATFAGGWQGAVGLEYSSGSGSSGLMWEWADGGSLECFWQDPTSRVPGKLLVKWSLIQMSGLADALVCLLKEEEKKKTKKGGGGGGMQQQQQQPPYDGDRETIMPWLGTASLYRHPDDGSMVLKFNGIPTDGMVFSNAASSCHHDNSSLPQKDSSSSSTQQQQQQDPSLPPSDNRDDCILYFYWVVFNFVVWIRFGTAAMADFRRDLGGVKEAAPAALRRWLACRAKTTTADLQTEESRGTELPGDADLALERLFKASIDSCELYMGECGRCLDGKRALLVELQKHIYESIRCLGK
ncbi:hypothetical protein B0T24DRAFT_705927 [Lasiosphaeria ovina]|uniref:Uncharacterized protein n=1 Tax=Lasiosphaeria ovina TaxID=92902 RepID=A0AAE0K6I8_9PEZI|nr:hypothetical protein B0T24DRAFT_705927 [Lasiosphaeria ovina]